MIGMFPLTLIVETQYNTTQLLCISVGPLHGTQTKEEYFENAQSAWICVWRWSHMLQGEKKHPGTRAP